MTDLVAHWNGISIHSEAIYPPELTVICVPFAANHLGVSLSE